jgi:predicted flavoprotein YhiN
VAWSTFFQEKCAGAALKNIAIEGRVGELILSRNGIEGSLVYAHSAAWREALTRSGAEQCHTIYLDLLPHLSVGQVLEHLSHARGSRSLSSHMQSRLGLQGAAMTLLRECVPAAQFADFPKLASSIKALPVRLMSTRPIDEAISTAGGVQWDSLNGQLMARAMPGVFCTGEMLDWEAPTGG